MRMIEYSTVCQTLLLAKFVGVSSFTNTVNNAGFKRQ